MTATTIFYNGVVTSVPGSYSIVDASGLEQVGLGASGIVALLGEAEGGLPVSQITDTEDLIRLTRPSQIKDNFRSGDLLEACGMCFEPSSDDEILAGAQQIIAMKVNPATAGSATFANAIGDALTVTSKDYGAFVNQVNVSIANGTNQGKLVTIIFEDVTESVDDLGGDDVLTLKYVTGTAGWGVGTGAICTAQLTSGGNISALGTRVSAGLDGDITDSTSAAVSVVSSSASDTQDITIYGLDASDNPVSETLTLTGVTPVAGSQVFKAASIWGARLDEAAVGSITVDTGATILTLTVGEYSQGMLLGVAMFVSGGVVGLVADGATTKQVILAGKSVSGATQLEARTLAGTTLDLGNALSGTWTWDGTTTVLATDTSEVSVGDWVSLDSDAQPFKITAIVASTSVTIENPRSLTIPSGATGSSYAKGWSELTGIVLGDVEAARSITISAEMGYSKASVQTTITKVADYFNARSVTISGTTYGFVCALVSGETAFSVANLDVMSAAQTIKGANYGFEANLYAIVEWINDNSSYLTAVAATGAQDGFPTNTTAPVFLAGGDEGTTAFANWQAALNLLRTVRVNTVVPLTGNAAVHAAVNAFCAYKAGAGRSECDAFVGLQNSGETTYPTKTELKAQIVDLNSRHVRAVAQKVDRYDSDGERTTFQPYFAAAVAAGMQAGSAVGTSLTHKTPNVLAFSQDTSWNPVDDADELINAGLLFMENIPGAGRRWVRNVTTHLSTTNLAYIEGSVNEAANYAAYTYRTGLEAAVGKKGFAGTVNAAKGVALKLLNLLVDEETLVQHRSLSFDLAADVLESSVEMAPVIPINFVKSTIHLVIAS